MIRHKDIDHFSLHQLIRQGEINLAGNAKLKIFGQLNCKSGKRMQVAHRVFFKEKDEALVLGYRPCGHCQAGDYQKWKINKMELFANKADPTFNLLPQDGEVNYFGVVMDKTTADAYLQEFLDNIPWKNDEAVIYGQRIQTKRKVAWYGDEPYLYTYSKTTKQALPWTAALKKLKSEIEKLTGARFNSCLMNLYHHGEEGMAWHSDAEKDLKKNGEIASVSLGAERKFSFKHKETKEKRTLLLEHGSLLVMKGSTQSHWLHRLPPTKLPMKERINLTFRCIVQARSTI